MGAPSRTTRLTMPPDAPSYDRLRLVVLETAEADPYDRSDDTGQSPQRDDIAPAVAHAPYVPLGHNRGRFFFAGMGGQARDFSARDIHTLPCLCELAPLSFWEVEYPSKTGANTTAAGAALMAACYRVGIYDPGRLRGRGAWIDDMRSVLHLGDRLLVDGQPAPLTLDGSPFIYENAIHLPLPLREALPTSQARKLLDLCMMPTWEHPGHMGRLLAGWCVVAPVCGAMPWRPHLWIAGEKSSGKTWIMEQIVSPVVGSIAFHVQSVTTEAGIRQDLGSDARPVIFDEAETQTDADRARIQNVLNLARQASSEGGAAIVKGSANGRATHYRIRSMFAFSSINYGVTQAADESRVVSLSLRADTEPGSQDRFNAMRSVQAEVVTADFAAALLARTMTMLPTIRHNASIFADSIAAAGHGRRTGDTVGVLLAGAWSLRSSKIVTPAEADRFLIDTAWIREAITKADVQPEWQRAIGHLMQHRIKVVRDHGPSDDVPVSELIEAALGYGQPGGVAKDIAERAMLRAGLRIVDGGKPAARFAVLAVWNNSTEVASAFNRSPWAAAWLSTLARAPGAAPAANPIRFGANGKQRSLCIPMQEVMQNDDS